MLITSKKKVIAITVKIKKQIKKYESGIFLFIQLTNQYKLMHEETI